MALMNCIAFVGTVSTVIFLTCLYVNITYLQPSSLDIRNGLIPHPRYVLSRISTIPRKSTLPPSYFGNFGSQSTRIPQISFQTAVPLSSFRKPPIIQNETKIELPTAIPTDFAFISFNSVIKQLFNMGAINPDQLHDYLLQNDVFEVFNSSSLRECPPKRRRIDYPDITNSDSLHKFLENGAGSFIFYQHLRKAGGTGFCDLAKTNLGAKSVPSYYCMPDMRGSLATPPWDDPIYLVEKLRNSGHRIAANEWDAFLEIHAAIPGAVLATTMRHPIDRWYSQYRFEHLEHRDGRPVTAKAIPMIKWYKGQMPWTMGKNYYVTTFLGDKDNQPPANKGDFYWTYHKYRNKPITFNQFQTAVRNLRRFHVVLITEWLSTSAPLLTHTLKWKAPPKQVLPHEVQAVRKEKKSKPAKDLLPPDDYAYLMRENIFDFLFYHIAKRIYLERLLCIRSAE